MPWLLNIVYAGLLTLLSPVILWRMMRHGRYRRGLRQKLLGRLPQFPPGRPVVWFHAVSVGEVLQLQSVIQEFRNVTADEYRILITTSTDTGYDLAVRRFTDCAVSWFPLDFSWSVTRALHRVRPQLVVLAELEFWPGFLTACRHNGVRTAVINARMSDRSFRGYSRIRWLIGPLLRQFSVAAVQSREYAERLTALGARPNATVITGSIKFDGVKTERGNPATQQLRTLFNIRPDDTVFIAGSTQDPEEQMAWDIWQQQKNAGRSLRLIIVPRHPERFDAVADRLTQNGVPLVRRSNLEESGSAVDPDAVILLDTIGELSACWGLADIAFVGGSFGARGGQNMLEPAAYGAAVLFGPNTWNFRDIVQMLRSEQAAIQVNTSRDLAGQVDLLLNEPQNRLALGQRARQLVLRQQGAVSHSVQLLQSALPETPSSARRSAA